MMLAVTALALAVSPDAATDFRRSAAAYADAPFLSLDFEIRAVGEQGSRRVTTGIVRRSGQLYYGEQGQQAVLITSEGVLYIDRANTKLRYLRGAPPPLPEVTPDLVTSDLTNRPPAWLDSADGDHCWSFPADAAVAVGHTEVCLDPRTWFVTRYSTFTLPDVHGVAPKTVRMDVIYTRAATVPAPDASLFNLDQYLNHARTKPIGAFAGYTLSVERGGG